MYCRDGCLSQWNRDMSCVLISSTGNIATTLDTILVYWCEVIASGDTAHIPGVYHVSELVSAVKYREKDRVLGEI